MTGWKCTLHLHQEKLQLNCVLPRFIVVSIHLYQPVYFPCSGILVRIDPGTEVQGRGDARGDKYEAGSLAGYGITHRRLEPLWRTTKTFSEGCFKIGCVECYLKFFFTDDQDFHFISQLG